MYKRAIPAVPASAPAQGRVGFDSAVKENLESMMGHRGDMILVLESNATLAEVILKVNAIIGRLQ